MKTKDSDTDILLNLLKQKKMATMVELQKSIKTRSRMTVYRKLTPLDYISSYSHSGKYYALRRVARFNKHGIWSVGSVCFSKDRTLKKMVERLTAESDGGFVASELRKIVKVKVDDVLLGLLKEKAITREKLGGEFVYLSGSSAVRRQQKRYRLELDAQERIDGISPNVLLDQSKAALIIFFSILNEKQRRLYAGLESLKVGRAGDKQIAELLGINEKTVSKGRRELVSQKIDLDFIRDMGGGRMKSEKKIPNSNR